MTTRTALAGPALAAARAMPAGPQSVSLRSHASGLLDRLAAWSDRHPPTHHRMGSWAGLATGLGAAHRAGRSSEPRLRQD
jgi:hypothetical protein